MVIDESIDHVATSANKGADAPVQQQDQGIDLFGQKEEAQTHGEQLVAFLEKLV